MSVGARAGRRGAERGGIVAWLLGGLTVLAALAVLGWMVALPGWVRTRVAAHTGAELNLVRLMGDPFAGRLRAEGWSLRAGAVGPVLAQGGMVEVDAPAWRGFGGDDKGERVIERVRLDVARLVLAPDAKGRWPALAVAGLAGLPFEAPAAMGGAGGLRIRRLELRVAELVVLDAASGREAAVPIAWRGEFAELTHTRPVVAALLAAVRER